MKETNMRHFRSATALALLAVVCLGACAKKEPPPPPPAPTTLAPTPVPFKVTSVNLGMSRSLLRMAGSGGGES